MLVTYSVAAKIVASLRSTLPLIGCGYLAATAEAETARNEAREAIERAMVLVHKAALMSEIYGRVEEYSEALDLHLPQSAEGACRLNKQAILEAIAETFGD